jgi:chloramphenicol 3-O-phosphotransferase
MEEQKPKQKILILRGKPGSGKSTIVSKFYSKPGGSWVAVSADHFFVGVDGRYRFDPGRIQEAHDEAYRRAINALKCGVNVIVDNTNKKIWEFQKYLDLASPTVDVKVVKLSTYFGSTKDVPNHIILSFDRDYEPYKGEGQVMVKDGKLFFKWP